MPDQWISIVRPARADFIKTKTSAEEKLVAKHFDYLTDLLHASKLILAGPCLDGAFSVVILRVENEAEARALVAQDPAVAAGIFTADLHPFRVSLLEKV